MRALFIATIFLGSSLLFLVQPMAAKIILPQFGGTPAVWTTSMLFFQLLLLAGYWIAHRAGQGGFRRVTGIVLSLVILATAMLRFGPWQSSTGFASVDVLMALMVLIGPAFLALAMCAPTIQGLFAQTRDERAVNPYFLYAASNLGSLIALLAYPFVIEPWLPLRAQMEVFRLGLLILSVLILLVSLSVPSQPKQTEALEKTAIPLNRKLLWMVMAAVPSSLMLGLTTFATTNVAPVPLFWVAPLAVYLLTFVVAFSRGTVIPSTFWARALPLLVAPLTLIMILESSEPIGVILGIHGAAFAVAALMCHTRLSETRPAAGNLTEFYLWLAIGGAVGGLFNAIFAPSLFATLAEYPIAIVAACLLRPNSGVDDWRKDLAIAALVFVFTLVVALTTRALGMEPTPLRTVLVIGTPIVVSYFLSRRPIRFALAIGGVFLATHLAQVGTDSKIVLADRSFFGVHRVLQSELGRFRLLAHGTTLHGIQDRLNPTRPLTYYTTNSPVGEIFANYEMANVGLVGLGVGSCAAYGRAGQKMTFFEIDPVVIEIAQNPKLFTFLQDSKADIELVEGDARLTLARRPNSEFDFLILDAFSSDAIPMHLLTKEAVQLYLGKLKPGGIIAIHISNRMLDLEPIVAKVALGFGVVPLALEAAPTEREFDDGMRPSIWMVIVRKRADADKLIGWRPAEPKQDTPLWTDDYSNILSAWSTD